MDLAVRQEKTLFTVNLIFAVLLWALLIVGTFGLALVYILAAYVFYLFIHSALVAQLKGSAVEISAEQFPDLHHKIQRATAKLSMAAPTAYVMNGNGVFNAFATRFMRRSYIVLLSSVLDAFQENDEAIDFYIGHELGHLHRQHLLWWPVLLPVSIFPLLMPAYRRACEATCDRYGQFCAATKEDAVRGLSVLAAGGKRWKSFSASSFILQNKESGGFWMSFHEITGSYPWLSKRVAMIQEGAGAENNFPKRSAGAWVLGLFCPGFLSGAFLPVLILYIFIIVLAVAIPAARKLNQKASGREATPPAPVTQTL